jgi:hypothetical protein
MLCSTSEPSAAEVQINEPVAHVLRVMLFPDVVRKDVTDGGRVRGQCHE